MNNLENFRVQELTSKELDQTNGGGLLLLPFVGFAWGYAYQKYVVN